MQRRYPHQRALPYRAIAYPGLGLISIGLMLEQGHASWALVALTAGCLVWPIVAMALERDAADPAARTLKHHLIEALLLGFLTVYLGLPTVTMVAVAVAVLVGIAAQAGKKHVGIAALAMLTGSVLGWAPASAVQLPAGLVSGLLSAALAVLFAVAVGLSGFSAVQVQHRAKTREAESSRVMRARSERLGRYLPARAVTRVSDLPPHQKVMERRLVTVAFIDLVGFSGLCERLQPEDVAQLLDTFVARVHGLAAQRGGALLRLLGDGALVGFGTEGPDQPATAPNRSAATSARACLAFVLALRQRLGRELVTPSGQPLQVRGGVASGYCSIGDWGSPQRLEFTLIGSAVNLAARLQAQAPVGAALVAESTAVLARLQPDTLPMRSLCVRGLGRQRAFRLG